jgi:pimeloyl-ACP methyl ester carboxylesterase
VIISRDGTQIGWHRAGEGPPTVLVHGPCGDKGNWIRCTPLLAGRLSLYAVDRRGRGRSGNGTEYVIQREYEDLAAVIAAISEPITLIGHSYGAIVSLGALSLTDRVHRLFLYDSRLLAARFHDCERGRPRSRPTSRPEIARPQP